ncbi:MAG TPA: carboxymuconolactone decarboxylase family protein [Anaeromyxobacter sp.]|nr:carboxymuconolactone decarboxylase family protein [Anaeromyxobacter sp.]
MSWIEPRPDRAHPWHVRLLLAVLARRGARSGSVRLWARAPRAFLAFLRLFKAVDRGGSPLPPALRALVMVRVSQRNRCAFCVDLNGARALERGASPEQLAALDHHATSPLFGAGEKAALALADAMTAQGAAVPPEVRRALRAAFTDDAIVELCALVAFQDMSSRFNAALDVPAEGACAVPARRQPASGGAGT